MFYCIKMLWLLFHQKCNHRYMALSKTLNSSYNPFILNIIFGFNEINVKNANEMAFQKTSSSKAWINGISCNSAMIGSESSHSNISTFAPRFSKRIFHYIISEPFLSAIANSKSKMISVRFAAWKIIINSRWIKLKWFQRCVEEDWNWADCCNSCLQKPFLSGWNLAHWFYGKIRSQSILLTFFI